PDSVPRTEEIRVDLVVLAFTLGVSVIAVFLFGLAPVVQVSEKNLARWIRSSGQRSIQGSGQLLRRALVVAEISLAVVLVIASGLMIRAFWKLQEVNTGFDPTGVMSFSINLPGSTYKLPDRLRFAETMEQRLASLPGVASASQAGGLPPLRRINANDTEIEGYVPTPEGPAQNVDYWNVVGNDYFKTMKIRLLDGRTFEPQDNNDNAQPVVMVNQALAKRFWKGSPIGRRVNPGFADPKVWSTIIGVVEDTKNAGMDKPAAPELYLQARQVNQFIGSNVSFVVRAANDSAPLESSIRGAIRELDPSLPVYNLWSMNEVVSKSMVQPRFLALLLAT